ncbi:MAG: hypothetical protein ACJASG_001278 [Oleiphilaceae bacterium]|jgi:hypothetical protein
MNRSDFLKRASSSEAVIQGIYGYVRKMRLTPHPFDFRGVLFLQTPRVCSFIITINWRKF